MRMWAVKASLPEVIVHNVYVVDQGHAVHLLQLAAQPVNVYVLRRALQQHVYHSHNKASRVVHDEQGDEHAEYRVDYHPPGRQNHDGGNYDGHGAEQVCEHVLERALHVHAVLRRAVENPGGQDVDQQTARADYQHPASRQRALPP